MNSTTALQSRHTFIRTGPKTIQLIVLCVFAISAARWGHYSGHQQQRHGTIGPKTTPSECMSVCVCVQFSIVLWFGATSFMYSFCECVRVGFCSCSVVGTIRTACSVALDVYTLYGTTYVYIVYIHIAYTDDDDVLDRWTRLVIESQVSPNRTRSQYEMRTRCERVVGPTSTVVRYVHVLMYMYVYDYTNPICAVTVIHRKPSTQSSHGTSGQWKWNQACFSLVKFENSVSKLNK